MKKILGIDCSSTTIGCCVLNIDDNNKISYQDLHFIKPNKEGNLIQRLYETREKLKAYIEKVNPDEIAVEEIISFIKGKSTAQTIIMLATFNRMACLLAYDFLKKPPELFNVLSIRHGIKLSPALPKKEEIPSLLEKRLNFKFPFILDKKNKIKTESYDIADAGAVTLYYALKLTDNLYKKPKKPKKNK